MVTLVFGARGNVGRHVVVGLLASGERVRAVSRNPAAGFAPGLEFAVADLERPETQISYEAACQASALPAPDSCPVLMWFAVICGSGSGARHHGLQATGPERRCGWS
jgi:nucleoside-diphosphate-sugar epimerase